MPVPLRRSRILRSANKTPSMQSKPQSRTQLLDDTLQTLYDLVTLRLSADVAGWMEFELTFAQLKALLVLSRRGKLALGALAQIMGIGSSATSILVQQLVSRGLVDRSEDAADRRRGVVLQRNSLR